MYAIREYYLGDIHKSKEMFLQLIDNKKSIDINRAIHYYYLGLIDKRIGNIEKSNYYFKKAQTLGKNTFIEERTIDYLNSNI